MSHYLLAIFQTSKAVEADQGVARGQRGGEPAGQPPGARPRRQPAAAGAGRSRNEPAHAARAAPAAETVESAEQEDDPADLTYSGL